MMNVQQTIARLRSLSPEQLRQQAQIVKNDSMLLPLVLGEDARRKKIDIATKGQMGRQPTVVDQRLAQMDAGQAQAMPEDVGIGALPAPNMQGMAEGGIVAFGDGGDVQRFQTGGIPRVGSHGFASIIPDKTGYEGMGIMEFLQAFGTDMLNKLPTEDKERLKQNQAKKEAAGVVDMSAYRPRPNMEQGQADILYEKSGLLPRAPVVIPPVDTGVVGTQTPAPSNKPPPAAGPRPAPASGNKPPVAPVAPVAPIVPVVPVVPEQDYLTQLDDARKKRGDVVDPYAEKTKKLTDTQARAEIAAVNEKKLEQKAELKEMFKGKEERIGKREAELLKSKDTNTGMAFLEAGLAMMQARGPGLAGIAQGAGVGLKQYAAGIDKIKSAQEKLDDARDRMEELRQNRESMNKSEIRNDEKGIRAIIYQGERDLLAGAKDATGVSNADLRAGIASNITRADAKTEREFRAGEAEKGRNFTADQAAKERENRIKVASMPGDQQRMLTTLGGAGGLEAGLAKMQEIQADKTGAAYAKLFTETVAEANKAGVTPPTAAQFAASLRQLAVALNPTKVPPAVDTSATTRP